MTASGDQRRDEATWADRVAALDESVARSGIKDLTTHSSGGDLGESEGLEDPELSGVHDCLRLIERVRRCAPGALSRFTSAEGANAPEADALEFPPTIGRFQIRRLLGQGGFGLVYLAHDPDLGRDVALKIPVAESLVSPSMRQRFLREAQAAAILNHPSIAAVYEAGRIGPICFIASEFVDGMTLSEWIAEHRQPWHPREAAHLIDTLAQAVQHAHSRGVLHRDIKPGNILVSPDVSHSNSVQAKLTDFGLAKILDAVPLAQTQTHALLGTPAYMSPEQASGNTRDVGVAADIHGLGVILYQLLTLKSPFERETYMQTLEAVRSCDPVAPRHLEKDIPRDLESICVKCLQKSPADRYSTASELAADLQ
ncbi:MAG: serine/threonine protein kinase, partial [Planctomycetales bacterium]|nr:serine/threonine protein kinase [Planctomycetales bacterium]